MSAQLMCIYQAACLRIALARSREQMNNTLGKAGCQRFTRPRVYLHHSSVSALPFYQRTVDRASAANVCALSRLTEVCPRDMIIRQMRFKKTRFLNERAHRKTIGVRKRRTVAPYLPPHDARSGMGRERKRLPKRTGSYLIMAPSPIAAIAAARSTAPTKPSGCS